MNWAIMIFLGVAAIVFLGQAVFLGRNHARWRGLLPGVTAAGLGVAALVHIRPALFNTDAETLRAQLDLRESQISSLRTDKDKLTSDVQASAVQLERAERTHARAIADFTSDVVEVRRRLATRPEGFVLDEPLRQARSIEEQARAEVMALTTLRLRAAPVTTASVPTELDDLRNRMATRLSTPSYDVETYPDKELIRGRLGHYYVVDLKNAASGVRFYFEGGKYTLARGSQEFRTSLNTFVGDVLSKFEGKVGYALFVRGSADQKPYEGLFETGAEFRRVKVLPNLGQDRYGVETSEHVIEGKIRNKDLPDLRAAFMQRLVADSYPTKPPAILEGTVSTKTNDRDRNVELILYVDW